MGTEEFIKQEEEHVLSVSRRGRRTSEAVGRLPYALTKTPTAAASAGSWFTISPSPSSGETHLAPCWTLIRPDSHRMVPCRGSGAAWSSAGGGSRISAQRGADWSLRLCQVPGLRGGGWQRMPCKALRSVGSLWHEAFGKEKSKIPEPFKFVFKPYFYWK